MLELILGSFGKCTDSSIKCAPTRDDAMTDNRHSQPSLVFTCLAIVSAAVCILVAHIILTFLCIPFHHSFVKIY